MDVETLISVEEYLNTSYDPDVEYVDGVLVERNGGDWLHGLVQSNLIFAIRLKYPEVFVIPELRSKTRETRFRLPDVCVLLHPPKTKYLLDADVDLFPRRSPGNSGRCHRNRQSEAGTHAGGNLPAG